MREFSDLAQHDSGDFLEYTGVEEDRLAWLRAAIAAGGLEAQESNPTGPGQAAADAAFQERCAERLRAVGALRDRFAALASAAGDSAGLAPVVAGVDRTLAEAAPYLDHPAKRATRRLGELHLDLIQVLHGYQVIALRLVREGASPVMPVRRWIGPAPALQIWLHAVGVPADWLFGATAPGRRLAFFTRSLSVLSPADMQPILAAQFAACHLDAHAMYAATVRQNTIQAAAGAAQLFTWWPEDPVELREYRARHAAQQAAWQQALTALQADLAELAAAGLYYAGWINYYNYE